MQRLVLALLVCSATIVQGQETFTLTAPEAVVSNLRYRVERFTMEIDDPATAAIDEGLMRIQLMGIERPIPRTCTYTATTNPTGTFLNNGLNKANMASAYAGNATTGSLKQRIAHRLFVMGESTMACGVTLTGTVTGSVP